LGGCILQISEIQIGAKIEVEVKYNGRNVSFRSQVVFIQDSSVVVNAITVDEQTLGFSENCQINFLYIVDGKVFAWENVTVKLIKYEGKLYHLIVLSGEGIPYNRRNSYRMYIGEDMPLYINTPNGSSAINVLVKDISENGVAFITKDDLSINRTFRLKLKDSNNRFITLSGIIIRKEYLEHLQSYLYGCRFNENNSTLGRYIAQRQIELLRKKSSSPMLSQNRTRHTLRQKPNRHK
jgi:c-di-GMP-binding flagellar brake protein YcgR